MLTGNALQIWSVVKGESKTDFETELYLALTPTFLFLSNNLFLELAIILNIAKWIYYILVIRTHRSIREYEINVAIMYEEKNSE